MDDVLMIQAVMPSGTNSQTAQYNYGVTTSGGSTVDSNDLLASIQFPDASSGSAGTNSSDKQFFTYNRAGQGLTFTDQNGTMHTYSYDLLGRRTADAVAVASGNPQAVDTAVLAQTITFDTGGRPYQLTSYDSATARTSGDIVNQDQDAYNGLGQLTTEYQEHSGGVNTSTSLKVQYAYVEMASAANNSRITSMTYPNGRVLHYVYVDNDGLGHGFANAVSRTTGIAPVERSGVTTQIHTLIHTGPKNGQTKRDSRYRKSLSLLK